MIETTNSSISYIADGIQTEWNYPYTFIKSEDIELYVTIENVRTKISSDDFSIDAETGIVTYPLSGDPVPALAIVEIVRNTEITQLEDSSIVAFKSNDVERIADKLTMICQDKYTLVKKYEEHILDTNNPHNVTKAQVGLGNVDNTSDLDKPVSTATQTALNAKQDAGDYATNSALAAGLATKQDVISDLSTIRSGAAEGATAVQPGDLATVATSGDYADLANKPGVSDLHDVSISSPTDLQVLSYDATTQKWKNSSNTATVAWGGVTGTLSNQTDLKNALDSKQDTLVSGTNIKTVNGNSLLGSGNVDIDALPSQAGQSGKYLTTDGTDASWANVDALPSQAGQSGKFLKTDGTNASWEEVNTPSGTWTQDNLVAGENVTITKKIDPTVITEDTVAVWHFDGTGTDSVNSLHLQNYPENGIGFRFDTNNKKFDSTSSMWKQSFADSYYSGNYFSNWLGADLRTYSLSSNKDMTIDFWYKPPVSTSATVARRGTIFALMYKSAPDYFSHGIYIVPNSDNTAISFGLANNYSGGTLGTAFIEDVPVTATFHHIAFELHGSTGGTAVTVYVDGIAKGSTTISNSSDFDYQQFNVFTTNGNNDAPSWVDELRLSKGLVYNGNFDDNLPTKPYSNDAGEDVYEINAVGNTTKNIGEVYYSQSSSAQDNPGGLPLFTGETIANADQVYPDFYTWVANHSALQISAADYETAITTYGECPKYVIDTTNKTIRLPLLKNYVKMANTTDGITQSGAGLPNITGHCSEGPNATVDGAFSRYGSEIANAGGGGTAHVEYQGDYNASRSSAIYGASDTVTPAHTTLYPWVCAYSAAIPASTAQAAQFQQALTGKADTDLSNMANVSQTVRAEIVSWMMPDYESAVAITATVVGTYNWVQIPCDAIVLVHDPVNQDHDLFISKTGSTADAIPLIIFQDASNGSGFGNGWALVPKGWYVSCQGFAGTTATYYPLKGVN